MVRSALLFGLAGSTILASVSALPQPTSAARRAVPASLGLLRRQDVDCTQPCQTAQTAANGCNFDPTTGDATTLTPSQQTCLCDGATVELGLTACAACLFSHATPDGLDQATAQTLIGLGETCAQLNGGGGADGTSLLAAEGLSVTGTSTVVASSTSSIVPTTTAPPPPASSSTSTGPTTTSTSTAPTTTSTSTVPTTTSFSSYVPVSPSSGTAASAQGTAGPDAPSGAANPFPTSNSTVFSDGQVLPIPARGLFTGLIGLFIAAVM